MKRTYWLCDCCGRVIDEKYDPSTHGPAQPWYVVDCIFTAREAGPHAGSLSGLLKAHMDLCRACSRALGAAGGAKLATDFIRGTVIYNRSLVGCSLPNTGPVTYAVPTWSDPQAGVMAEAGE